MALPDRYLAGQRQPISLQTEEDRQYTPEEEDRSRFLNTIHKLATDNVGDMRDAFNGFYLHSVQNPDLLNIMQWARSIRQQEPYLGLRRIHASYLAVYAANRIQLAEGNLDYTRTLKLASADDWDKRIWTPIAEKNLDFFADILLSKDLITSEPNRSNAFAFIKNRVFGDKAIKAADYGSSFGFPWARAICEDCNDFDPYIIKDQTTFDGQNGLLLNANQHRINAQVTLLDHTDPNEDIDWFLSNCFPKDFTQAHIDKTKARIARYSKVPGIEFRRGNMLDPTMFEHGEYDVASAVMSGYELPWDLQQQLVNEVMPLSLNDEGVQLINDYVEVVPTKPDDLDPYNVGSKLIFTNDRNPFTHKTAIRGAITGYQWMEVLEYENSRGTGIARNGKHFASFMQATAHLPHNIAQAA